MSTYAATKAFVLYFSEGLHEEAARHGVTVTCLCPGPVRTRFQETAGVAGERLPGMAWTSVDQVVDAALSALRRKRAIALPGAFRPGDGNERAIHAPLRHAPHRRVYVPEVNAR